ncbi:ParB/RepB/Spo0J family partition protein [Dactylosporangium darangshiense]|uniref:ParB N-terminal domain-containing protein n=1 Tax=Dactylosporangium darangshiense TaxID=579108 RepID=A0ABP8DUM6_9ACTN
MQHDPAISSLTASEDIERVALEALRPADSPRLSGEDEEHIRVLAESGAGLPPIIVHRGNMRIIDGMHRIGAARLRGDETIEVRYFDGTPQEAFVLAVRSNIAHGRPLSLQDRMLAAERIINENPAWSNRSIAEVAGLGANTIGNIRRRVEATNDAARGTQARVGRDGRRRPVDNVKGRLRAAEIIRSEPDAPLRAVARRAGVSPTTAQDVRNRLRRGEEPVPVRQLADAAPVRCRSLRRQHAAPRRSGIEEALRGLQRDPALRFNESGRTLVRWLMARAVRFEDWQEVSGEVPTHCTYILAEVARRVATEWQYIAEELQNQTRQMA